MAPQILMAILKTRVGTGAVQKFYCCSCGLNSKQVGGANLKQIPMIGPLGGSQACSDTNGNTKKQGQGQGQCKNSTVAVAV